MFSFLACKISLAVDISQGGIENKKVYKLINEKWKEKGEKGKR
jgi:hypothetical protein